MDSVPDQNLQLNGETLTRHEKAAIWMALHQLRIYHVESINEGVTTNWDPEEIADGKRSVLERLQDGPDSSAPLSSLGRNDVRLLQSALGYYVFNNSGCTAGEKRRARELISQFEEI